MTLFVPSADTRSGTSAARTPTPIDALAERWVEDLIELSPVIGLRIGREVADGYGDLSPDGHAERAARAASTLAALDSLDPQDQVDAVTKADLSASLSWVTDAYAAGWHLRDLNVLSSVPQDIRQAIDLLPRATAADEERLAARLSMVPAAIAGYIATLREGVVQGVTPARRQAAAVAKQASAFAAPDGFFASVVAGTGSRALRREVDAGVDAARVAFTSLEHFLTHDLAPAATPTDAVGRDLYSLASRHHLGTVIDPEEIYRWGLDVLAQTVAEQEAAARELGSTSVLEAVAELTADPRRTLTDDAKVRRWLQRESDLAMAALDDTSVEIPLELRSLQAMTSPSMQGGAHYTAPSDDLSRPGRIWWPSRKVAGPFATWRERTTMFHEGIPGHHLQMGMAVIARGRLNTWRRQLAGSAGHSEGWALYAERLMEKLGFLEDPADRLGMLDAQRLRAARVVIDIGVHLQLPHPDGGGWDAASATRFLRSHTSMSDQFVRFEVDRYLGWPGQASAYSVGLRVWNEVLDARRGAEGNGFSLREFHREALELGGVSLDALRSSSRTHNT